MADSGIAIRMTSGRIAAVVSADGTESGPFPISRRPRLFAVDRHRPQTRHCSESTAVDSRSMSSPSK